MNGVAMVPLDTLGAYITYPTDASHHGHLLFTTSDPLGLFVRSDVTLGSGVGGFSQNVFLMTPGLQTVTVTDADSSTIVASQTVLVGPARIDVLGLGYAAAGTAQTLTLWIRDLGGNLVNYPTDADHNGHIRITSSDPLASIGVAALDGFTDFVGGFQAVSYSNVRMRTPGLQTVTVTDLDSNTITGTLSVLVGPAQLEVSGLLYQAAGLTQTVTVKALDTLGGVVAGYLGTVHLMSSDAASVLPADYTFTAGDAGVHSFTLTLKTTSTTAQSVSVVDTAGPALGGDGAISGSQSVLVGPVGYQISSFAYQAAGSSQGYYAYALDINGNHTLFNDGVIVTSSDPLAPRRHPAGVGFLFGNLSFGSGVTFNTPGIQTLTITDQLSSTITSSVSVPVGPAQLEVSGLYQAAGLTQTVTVKALDTLGAVVSGYLRDGPLHEQRRGRGAPRRLHLHRRRRRRPQLHADPQDDLDHGPVGERGRHRRPGAGRRRRHQRQPVGAGRPGRLPDQQLRLPGGGEQPGLLRLRARHQRQPHPLQRRRHRHQQRPALAPRRHPAGGGLPVRQSQLRLGGDLQDPGRPDADPHRPAQQQHHELGQRPGRPRPAGSERAPLPGGGAHPDGHREGARHPRRAVVRLPRDGPPHEQRRGLGAPRRLHLHRRRRRRPQLHADPQDDLDHGPVGERGRHRRPGAGRRRRHQRQPVGAGRPGRLPDQQLRLPGGGEQPGLLRLRARHQRQPHPLQRRRHRHQQRPALAPRRHPAGGGLPVRQSQLRLGGDLQDPGRPDADPHRPAQQQHHELGQRPGRPRPAGSERAPLPGGGAHPDGHREGARHPGGGRQRLPRDGPPHEQRRGRGAPRRLHLHRRRRRRPQLHADPQDDLDHGPVGERGRHRRPGAGRRRRHQRQPVGAGRPGRLPDQQLRLPGGGEQPGLLRLRARHQRQPHPLQRRRHRHQQRPALAPRRHPAGGGLPVRQSQLRLGGDLQDPGRPDADPHRPAQQQHHELGQRPGRPRPAGSERAPLPGGGAHPDGHREGARHPRRGGRRLPRDGPPHEQRRGLGAPRRLHLHRRRRRRPQLHADPQDDLDHGPVGERGRHRRPGAGRRRRHQRQPVGAGRPGRLPDQQLRLPGGGEQPGLLRLRARHQRQPHPLQRRRHRHQQRPALAPRRHPARGWASCSAISASARG